ncbi:HET domain protein [Penicillium capsulatum]|uniref:HET domain protein n=1 Tax=Penicillium capsulatum TaxID=69766 RepID=A0A9W9IB38_9EURO|nr:HET domain protein [Penicillium capsulatum]KAJ6135753.1 HET domain protein [Penicillium capsulatum]
MAVVQDRDKACSQCKQIPPIQELTAMEFEIWSNLAEFEARTRSGCPFCSFIFSRCPWGGRPSGINPNKPVSLAWNGGVPFVSNRQALTDFHDIRFGITPDMTESFSIFVDPDEPIASCVTAREIHPNPASQEVFALIKGWISSCVNGHACCQSTNNPLLPRFVVEVADRQDPRSTTAAPHLRLIENDQNSKKKAPYVALSYVWGVKRQPLQLMKENLTQFKHSIDYTLLPPTMQDFVLVARALGIKYIWTDILCIVQDDPQIKKQQIHQMKDIFGNCYLAVQAGNTHSVHDSFLQPRSPQRPTPLKLFYGQSSHIYLRGYTPRSAPRGSAGRRAWVFEESVLPSRLVIYGEDQILFACRRETRYEDGRRINAMPCSPMFFNPRDWRISWQNRVKQPTPDRRLDFLSAWYNGLCTSYASRLLSDPGDRLAAIGGVVPRIQERVGGRYVAGVWETDMPWALMWESQRDWTFPGWMGARPDLTRPTKPCAPSWSWASVDGKFHYLFVQRFEDIKESDFVAAVCMKSIQVNPLGEIINDGKLRVCGPLLYTCVMRLDDHRRKLLHQKFKIRATRTVLAWSVPKRGVDNKEIFNPHVVPTREQQEDPIACANFDMEHDDTTCTGVWCLLLTPKSGLLLEQVKNSRNGCTFRRLGLFRVSTLPWPHSVNNHVRVEVEIV